jgi:hypothetical protein
MNKKIGYVLFVIASIGVSTIAHAGDPKFPPLTKAQAAYVLAHGTPHVPYFKEGVGRIADRQAPTNVHARMEMHRQGELWNLRHVPGYARTVADRVEGATEAQRRQIAADYGNRVHGGYQNDGNSH